MDEYVPYIALLIVAIGLGGPALWVVFRSPCDEKEGRERPDQTNGDTC
ncbi:MAG: hypothetical protein H6953_05935 [Chromatiaceae bacterium]|nr:hypothetical protein [Chromatiaceae bacterium]MCP5314924.1 hypothetical protein [Chromatiaceae bacterium]